MVIIYKAASSNKGTVSQYKDRRKYSDKYDFNYFYEDVDFSCLLVCLCAD